MVITKTHKNQKGGNVMRIYNFAAGPAVLPLEVLKNVQKDLVEYEESGMSVMEMSHRSQVYQTIIDDAEKNLRDLLDIPANYKVLFLQGGGTLQFSMIPLNLLKVKAGYINSGHWSIKAISEALKVGYVDILGSSEDKDFTYVPRITNIPDKDLDYVYYCDNNTIFGTKFNYVPETKRPLVCDMSSCFLSEKVDVSKYGLIFAGAQKNVGPAGVTIVIIRDDLLDSPSNLPTYLRYKIHADKNSLYNTPPAFNIYVCGEVFKWLKRIGGLDEIHKRDVEKAGLLYNYLDSSTFYTTKVEKESRSIMNVTFNTPSADLDCEFVKDAEKMGLVNLKGHRVSGGLRASIYNAMPLDGVKELVKFMDNFAKKHQKG